MNYKEMSEYQLELWARTGDPAARGELQWRESKKPKLYSKEWFAAEEAKEQAALEAAVAETRARLDKEDAEREAVERAERAEQERLDNCPEHQEYLRISANRNDDDHIDLDLEDHYKLAVYESDRFFETEARKHDENRKLQQELIKRDKDKRKQWISDLFYPVTRLWKTRRWTWTRIWLWWNWFKFDLIMYGIIAIGVVFIIWFILALYWGFTTPSDLWMSDL